MKNSTKLWLGFIVFMVALALITMPPTGTTSKQELKEQLKLKDLEIAQLKRDSASQADSTAKYKAMVEAANKRIAAAEAARTQAQIQSREATRKYESIKMRTYSDHEYDSVLNALWPR